MFYLFPDTGLRRYDVEAGPRGLPLTFDDLLSHFTFKT